METHAIWIWIGFNLFVLAMLALDLGVFHRQAHTVSMREAAAWSGVWVSLALLFNLGVYYLMGPDAGLQFLTGYLIEKALSVDNIFIFVLIFGYFGVPSKYQHRILFWGILGALVMRGTLIGAGALLLDRLHWIIYIFGAFLVVSGIRMAFAREANIEVEANPIIRLMRRFMPVTTTYYGQSFFVRQTVAGRLRTVATPMFVVLILVETTDLIFALDSIPAIFAVTRDPFLVYTSNVFAILGLRALYFLLAGVIHRFHLLKLGLSGVLTFVGSKMLVADLYEVPTVLSLGVIAAILTASIVASLLFPRTVLDHSPVDVPAPDASPGAQGVAKVDAATTTDAPAAAAVTTRDPFTAPT